MEQTRHYGLNKPGESDYADVAALNDNAEKIDAALKGLEDGKAGLDGDGRVPVEQLPDGVLLGDIDCGTFEAAEPVALHNSTSAVHPLLAVDGNVSAASPAAETLEEHMEDPQAHQNIHLDGNMN